MTKAIQRNSRRREPPKELEPFIDALAELLAAAFLRDMHDSISAHMTVHELFAAAGLVPQGPVLWGQLLEERRPGVYVVSLTGKPDDPAPKIDLACVPEGEKTRWVVQQPVLYIGRATRSLQGRLAQFYRHQYGKSAPHRGGQAVIPLKCERWVYWATTDSPTKAERQMIDTFSAKVGKLPYGNRRR